MRSPSASRIRASAFRLGVPLFAALLLAVLGCAEPQASAAEDAAPAEAAREGSGEAGADAPGPEAPASREPVVVLLSFDGVHPSYLERAELPALARMAREGARAEALTPVFPSSTFPNHASLATGAHADVHGIVNNEFRDPELGHFRYADDARFLRAEPLWAAAERQGVRAATFFWVMAETDWPSPDGPVGATHRRTPFDSGIGEREKVRQILAWLDLPPDERPRLVLSWWHGADAAGHRHGPGSAEALGQLRGQDAALAELLDGLDAREAWPWTTLLVVSDHGMAAVEEGLDPEAPLEAAGLEGRVISVGPVAHVYLEDPSRSAEAAAAYAAVEGVRAWTADAVPAHLHYRLPARAGDVVALASPPRAFVRGLAQRIQRAFRGGGGGHGYDPAETPAMRGILLALGRGAAPGAVLPPQRAIDVAPTVTRLLGIDPPADAEGRPIEALLPAPASPRAGLAPERREVPAP